MKYSLEIKKGDLFVDIVRNTEEVKECSGVSPCGSYIEFNENLEVIFISLEYCRRTTKIFSILEFYKEATRIGEHFNKTGIVVEVFVNTSGKCIYKAYPQAKNTNSVVGESAQSCLDSLFDYFNSNNNDVGIV